MEVWSHDLWPLSNDLDLGNLVDAAVPMVLMPVWPVCSCGLPMRCSCAWAWHFGPTPFDVGAMTLTLGILWMLLCPRYWCQCDQFVHVDYPLGVDVHENGILVLWPLTMELWPWPCVFLWWWVHPSWGPCWLGQFSSEHQKYREIHETLIFKILTCYQRNSYAALKLLNPKVYDDFLQFTKCMLLLGAD